MPGYDSDAYPVFVQSNAPDKLDVVSANIPSNVGNVSSSNGVQRVAPLLP